MKGASMKIKDQAIKEIESLNPNDLLTLIDIIKNYKKGVKKNNLQTHKSYMKVRKVLKECKGSFSKEIILNREDRI